MAKKPSRSRGRKKISKNILRGVAHIQSTFNNTVITITDPQGNALAWSSAGANGFKGSGRGACPASQPRAAGHPPGPLTGDCGITGE